MRYLIGIGNYTAHDDAVGVCLVEHVINHGLDTSFRAIDLGTNLLNLIAYLNADTDAILLVDAARMGLDPGGFRFFTPSEVEDQKHTAGVSTHEGDLLRVLALARAAGYSIPRLEIMGVEPKRTVSGVGLSPELASRLEAYAGAAARRVVQL